MASIDTNEDIIKKLGGSTGNFRINQAVARLICVLLKRAAENGHMFYTAECSLDQLRAESSHNSIVLTPCESLVAEERPSMLFTNNEEELEKWKKIDGVTIIDFDQLY